VSLTDSEKGISAADQIKRAIHAVNTLAPYIPDAAAATERLGEALSEIIDAAEHIREQAGTEEAGDVSTRLDRIEARLDAIGRLGRKYGGTIAEILAFRDKCAAELSEIRSSDELTAELSDELAEVRVRAFNAARALSGIRRDAAARLGAEIMGELELLDMRGASFTVGVTPDDSGEPQYNPRGFDAVEFNIAVNPGEPEKPLRSVASGGELSRVMLALSVVLSGAESAELLVFDEIDTGVSGATAERIGLKLKGLSAAGASQVLCVTHSAQIAALADNHYLVAKSEQGGRAHTTVTLLERGGRVAEVARIIGGVTISDAVLKTAEEMVTTGR
jgi:DNA repair protein RecN (Recombination protein N)